MHRSGVRTSSVLPSAMLLLWMLGGVSVSARAGANANGMLVVHDPVIAYTDTGTPPFPSETPACAGVDDELPAGIPPGGMGYVWKVYAAFPLNAAPRLKAFAMGATFPPTVTVLTGGVVHEMDFELTTAGWPFLSGYGVMVSFLEVQTTTVAECYWLAGYGDSGVWSLAQHPTVLNTFVDDSYPPIEEPIVGLGSIGFGEPGTTFCPYDDSPGACCLLDGSCQVTDHTGCDLLEGIFRGVMYDCDPFPCHIGACCYWDHCEYLSPEECAQLPAIYLGDLVLCEPYPCQPNTVCCAGTACWLCPVWACEAGGFLAIPDLTSCYPNPCPPPTWACCLDDGTCLVMTQWQCADHAGEWLPDVDCEPSNPCGPIGACCLPDGSCVEMAQSPCVEQQGEWWLGQTCSPNDPCASEGACCLSDGTCLVLTADECAAQEGQWGPPGSLCLPNPCEPTPTEKTTWGRIKNRFR